MNNNKTAISLVLLYMGAFLQCYSNKSSHPILFVTILLIVGYFLVHFLFRYREEKNAFILSFSMCILVSGLSQCYSLFAFDKIQSTTDSAYVFFPLIKAAPPFTTLSDISVNFNSRLAPIIWQHIYKFTWFFTLDFGLYIGVMFNSFVIGLSSSITVNIARIMFGNDMQRLQRVNVLSAFCGLFILFGAILLRDCFTTILNVIVLRAIVKWLVSSSRANFISCLITTAICAIIMSYLRLQAVLLFGLFLALGFSFEFISKKANVFRVIIILGAISAITLSETYVASYLNDIKETQNNGLTTYSEGSRLRNSESSLGLKFVVNQPLPIRILMGTGMFMVNPIPLWSPFVYKAMEYHLIKGYHGIYQIVIIPYVIIGYLLLLQLVKADYRKVIPLLYVGVYYLVNLIGVIVTSLEQRHLGQYFSALIIVAASPDLYDKQNIKKIHFIRWVWFAIVIVVHISWLLIKAVM